VTASLPAADDKAVLAAVFVTAVITVITGCMGRRTTATATATVGRSPTRPAGEA